MFIVYIICYANTYKHKNMHGIIKDTPKLLYIDQYTYSYIIYI